MSLHKCLKCYKCHVSAFSHKRRRILANLPEPVLIRYLPARAEVHSQSRIQVQTQLTSQVVGRRQVRIGIRGRVVTIEVRQAIKVTIVSVATAERRPETRTYRLREYTRLKAVQRYKFHTIIKNLIIKNRLTAVICSSPPTISEEKKEQYFKELVLHPPGMPGLHAQPLPRFARVPCFRVAPYPAMRHIPLGSGRSHQRIRRGATTGTQWKPRARSDH